MRPEFFTSRAILASFVASSVWTALVVLAPFMVPSGTLQDLSGTVGTHENDDQFEDLSAVPKAVYWIGDGQCHQIANRSFFLNDNQMPFCARDLGLFIGLSAGFGFVTFFRFKLHPIIAFAGLVPMGLDGGLQMITDYESNNLLRIVTGIVAGVALALLLAHYVFLFQEDSRKKRKKPSRTPAPEPGKEL